MSVPLFCWLGRRWRYADEVMCEDMSKTGFVEAERYVSSLCWLSRWEGECVSKSVALRHVRQALQEQWNRRTS